MKSVFAAVLATLAVLLLHGCGEGNAEPTTNTSKAVPVRVQELTSRSFNNYLQVTGTVEARNHINLIAEEGGTLQRISRDKGRMARAGDTLAVLENRVLTATYHQARAALNQARLDYSSKKVLFEKKAISENEYLNAKYGIESAEAAFELAQARYDKLAITAPISGVVNDRYYDIGAYVNPMTPIFEMIDKERLKISAGVAERFLADIEVGTPVTITFDAFPELSIESAVSFRSSSIDPVNRTFQIEVDIANPEGRLAPQMVANVQVLRQRYAESIVVPLDALMESEAGWFVYVADGGVARKVPVERVAIQESAVLTRGLQAHQQLVVVGQQNLTEGDSLKVVSQ